MPASKPRILLLPDIDWVLIPGGEFVYQQGERRTLPPFRIARYPVTNVQYQTFIDARGYDDDRWWSGLERPEPEASRWPQANRPRTNVNAYEAVAFTRWLSAQFRYAVRLPHEEEWERAARGSDGREYPWGNSYESGRANIDERGDNMGFRLVSSAHIAASATVARDRRPRFAIREGGAKMAREHPVRTRFASGA